MPARRMLSFSNVFSSLRSSRRETGDEDDHSREPYSRMRHATADFTEADDDEESNEESNHEEDEDDDEDDDRRRDSGTVLPLFSESHLDALPVYSITHAIRIIVQTRTETALTWEQLRSPQVSQFLVVITPRRLPSFCQIAFTGALDFGPHTYYCVTARASITLGRGSHLLTPQFRNRCKSRFASSTSREQQSMH